MTLLAQQRDQPQPEPEHRYTQLPTPAADEPAAATAREPVGPDGSVGQLVAQLSDQVSRLVRDEIALAEAEAKQRVKRLGFSAGALGMGGGLAFFGAACFVTAAVLALMLALRPWVAALCVGIALFILAGMLALPGLLGLRFGSRGAGRESIESVKADVATLRRAVRR